MRFSILIVLSLTLAACSHEAENTGMKNSSSQIVLPATYAMSLPAQTGTPSTATDLPVAKRISRFERQMIIPGGKDGEMTPCAKNFDGIMDHLELIMKDEIEKNNEIAQKQAAIPGYEF